MSLAQRGVYWGRKINGRDWQDSDDEETYTVTSVERNTLLTGKHKGQPGRILVAHCKRKKDGVVIHAEGERLPYVAAKFGFSVTNGGVATGENTKDGLPQPEDAES